MSAWSARCASLMKSAHVVCIDHRLTVPSRTPDACTNAVTRSVRSPSSIRSAVLTTIVSARTINPLLEADTASTGFPRVVTV